MSLSVGPYPFNLPPQVIHGMRASFLQHAWHGRHRSAAGSGSARSSATHKFRTHGNLGHVCSREWGVGVGGTLSVTPSFPFVARFICVLPSTFSPACCWCEPRECYCAYSTTCLQDECGTSKPQQVGDALSYGSSAATTRPRACMLLTDQGQNSQSVRAGRASAYRRPSFLIRCANNTGAWSVQHHAASSSEPSRAGATGAAA